jgi:hypothetical protein
MKGLAEAELVWQTLDDLKRGDLVLPACGSADAEGGHAIEENLEAVIVINDDRDVGPEFLDQLLGRQIPIEKRFPVRILGDAGIHCDAN